MENNKKVIDKLVSEVVTYNKVVPFFRFMTVCETTLEENDEISPQVDGIDSEFAPVPGFRALYRLIGDGSHAPTFSGMKASSLSEAYVNTLNEVNLIEFL